jgi:hypothetical protein
MFRENTQHLQRNFFSTFAQLSLKRQERLATSWAGEFYREVFCRVDERDFEIIYSDVPSRPNIPVNQLVGIEILKNGYGWSDEELFDHLNFDLQVRYALGVRDIEADICTLRTIYNFRERVSCYEQATGENLFTVVFEHLTDEQIQALELDTRRQRMDSTQIASNIRTYSRLHLVVEVLQRATRMLTPEDEICYAEQLQPYVQGTAGQYCYRIKSGEYAQHLEQLGRDIATLLPAWEATYAAQPAYRLLQRVFHEHFTVTDPAQPTQITVKPPEELSASSLQSPDDPDATYRTKNGQGYRGYVVNVTETCDPENDVQLITKVQVAPNTTDDQALLVEALPEIQERMPVTNLDVDGGYIGPDATATTDDAEVTLHPTAIRGAQPDPDKVGLAEFTWDYSDEEPTQVTCPHDQTVPVRPGRAEARYLADFDAATCADCPLREKCPTAPLKRRPARVLRVTRRQIEVAQLRQACAEANSGPPYLRPAVEATVRSLKHPFGAHHSQVPVRGLTRVTMIMMATAVMVNLRRIWRYRQTERSEARENQSPDSQDLADDSFLALVCTALRRCLQLLRLSMLGCNDMCVC